MPIVANAERLAAPLPGPAVAGLEVLLMEAQETLEQKRQTSAFLEQFSTCSERVRLNFVFQGGGILGIAHLGFLFTLERAGVRVAGAAGTSAGAIVALLIAAARTNADQEVSSVLTSILWRMPAKDFIDGPYRVRRLVKFALRRRHVRSFEMILPLFAAMRRLLRSSGLNTGNSFLSWLTDVLYREFQVRTVLELNDRLVSVARGLGASIAATQGASSACAVPPASVLKLVATGVPQSHSAPSSGLKFVFPEDLALFSSQYEHASPAVLARASMSVPVFFEPFTLRVDEGPWRQVVPGRLGAIVSGQELDDLLAATDVTFVDGGLLSNFPIDAFQDGPLRSFPTVGVALLGRHPDRNSSPRGSIAAFMAQASRILDAMRHARDRDALAFARAIQARGGAKVSVAFCDVGDHNWLNFQLDDNEISDLFRRGAEGAVRFLRSI